MNSQVRKKNIPAMKKLTVKIIFIIAALLHLCAAALAAVPYEQIAANFLAFRNSDKLVATVEVLEENSLNPGLPAIASGALVRLTGGGYILIAPAANLSPVKAYSFTRNFEDLPPAVQRYFRQELEGAARAAQTQDQTAAGREGMSASETQSRWDFLLNYQPARQPLSYTPDTWLIKSTWDQGYPFNKFTPRISGAAALTGCVNTALAQVLRYHRYPAAAKGVASYTWNGQPLKAVLFKNYQWDQMPEAVDAATPAWQADQVASLISDLGIANHTAYGLSGSSAYLHTTAVIQNFGYSNQIQNLTNANAASFFTGLKGEIDAERPVLLSLPGHMVVADGYASDGTGHRFHLNMGWGGYSDDFYYLDQTIQAGGLSFTVNPGDLTIYFPLKPCTGSDCEWASGGGADVPPVINTAFTDLILNNTVQPAAQLFVDARDENGDPVALQAKTTNGLAVQPQFTGHILSLAAPSGSGGTASKITVTAAANDRKAEKSFVALVLDKSVGFGKSYEVAGQFKAQADVYRHPVVLDGACTISGDRGYSNQAFYAAVLDSGDTPVLAWSNVALTGTLARGSYTLAASLKSGGSQYPYTAGDHEAYVLKVSCPNADDSTATIAGVLGIDLSGINILRGDIDGNGLVDLADAILTLQILALQPPSGATPNLAADVNGDQKIGAPEVIYILQTTSGTRD